MEPQLTPSIVVGLFLLLTIYNSIDKNDISEVFRKSQAREMANESEGIMRKIETYTNENVKYAKRNEVEKICRQAGMNLKFHHVLVLRLACSIALFIMCLLIGNIFLAIEMLLVGHIIPMQVITFLRNKRVEKLEQEIGPMMQMVTKRYLTTKDFVKAMNLTKNEFKGMEPLYTELKITCSELEANTTVEKALDNLAERCDNKFLERFSDFYKIASAIGTHDARQNLLGQAYEQYEEDRQLRMLLKRELSEPVKDSYIMVATVPLFSCFGFVSMEGYGDFLLNQTVGQIMVAAIFGVILLVVWLINNKIGAPLK